MSKIALALILVAAAPLAAANADLLAAYAQLRNAPLDAARVAVADNITLKKDAGTLQFKSGTFYALQPVLDKVSGLVFVGDGVFTFQPPSEIEQKHLARFANGQPRLEEPFKEAVLLFTDSTFAEVSGGGAFKAGAVDSKATGLLADTRKMFRNDLKRNNEAHLLAGLVSDRQSLFMADIHGQKHGRFLFQLDAMDGESESLIHDPGGSFDAWSALSPAGYPSPEQRALIHTSQIDLDVQVDKGGNLQSEAVSRFTALQDGPRVLYLQLAPKLRVSKITDATGAELKFIQEPKDKDGDLWVILPAPLVKGQAYSWKVVYGGEGVVQKAGGGNFYVGERARWYPKLDIPGELFNDRSMYHMKFRSPADLILVATGKPIKKSQESKITVSEWETETPYTVVGFNFGDYKTKTYKNGDQEITVYANKNLGDELKEIQVILDQNPQLARQLGITTGGFDTTGLMNQSLTEATNALNIYTAYFGPLPSHTLSLSQQPASNFGQSWPTLVFMPYTSFLDGTIRHQLGLDQSQNSRQFFEGVASHEISHQWWGHLVSWRDYHDQWLSEGFAQFSAGLFTQKTQKDKEFRAFLDVDRNSILAPLPNTTVRANDAGPISLGLRLDTEKTPGAYELVYAKGGFVLHMLRMLLYDFRTGDDSRFISLMRDFAQTYAGKSASTADFKAICDKHFNANMAWFFDQWVYGTGLPKIALEYSITDGPQGPLLVVDAKQQNVPEGFQSVMPFILRYKTGAGAGRVNISKSVYHTELQLKEKPESVEFNPLYGVLCELDVKKR